VLRVLLIDDDEAFTALAAERLAADGISSRCETDGAEGVRLAITGNFDVIVLDVMMPELDGAELLRRLRHESGVPALILMARGDSLDGNIGLELGVEACMPAPCCPRELAARLPAIVRRTRAEMSSIRYARRRSDPAGEGASADQPARRSASYPVLPLGGSAFGR
jgi:DNA-binding response OmpR family regulator